MIKSGLRPTAQLRIATVLLRKTDRRDAPFAIAILAIIILALNIGKNNNEVTEPLVREEDGLPLTLTEENLNTMIDYMNSYDEMGIHYNIFENIYTDDGEYVSSNYFTGISSYINLLKQTEWTIDSNKIYIGKDEDYIATEEELADAVISFEEAFGFDFKDYDNVYDLSCAIARTQGAVPESFVGSKINVQMYDDLYEKYGQKYYYYDNEDFDPQIEDYDEILSKDFKVMTKKDNLGNEFISYVDIRVVYKKDNKIIEKFWETNIWLFYDEAYETK